MLAYEDKEMGPRLKGRFLGWGSGGPARLDLMRTVRGKDVPVRGGATAPGTRTPLHVLERRDPASYSRGYSGFLNPMYEAGMSHLDIADALARSRRTAPRRTSSSRCRTSSTARISASRRWSRTRSRCCSRRSGNPWGIVAEDVYKDLYVTNFTRLDGYKRMVWTTAHFDRNHWNPEDPMKSIEVFVANEYRAKNPEADIRVMNFDPPMTHYGHLELPRQLAAAHYSVVRWLVKPE